MKGIIFTNFQEMIEASFGLEFWDKIVTSSELPSGGIYISFESYPDHEFDILVYRLSELSGHSVDKLLENFGRYLFPRLHPIAKKYSTAPADMFDFIGMVNEVIHTDVKKLYPDAAPPSILVSSRDTKKLVLHYHSKRKLCSLVLGMIYGIADFFGENIKISEGQCTRQGDDFCSFLILRVH